MALRLAAPSVRAAANRCTHLYCRVGGLDGGQAVGPRGVLGLGVHTHAAVGLLQGQRTAGKGSHFTGWQLRPVIMAC